MKYNPKWFQSVEKNPIPKAPAFSKTLQIDRVAVGSPAANLNLRPGDKLLSVNGKAALVEDIPSLLAKSPSVQYRFFLPRESAFLEVATTGLPLGIETSASSDAIVEQYNRKGEFENDGLLSLWEREDYNHIRQACAISNKRLNKRNLMGKLMGKAKSFPLTNMMTAICDIETGKIEAGYDVLGDYAANHGYAQTSDIQAILDFYNGMEAKRTKNVEGYQRQIESAYSSYPQSQRIRHEAVKAGIEIDRKDGRVGRAIETDKAWNVLEGGIGARSLNDTLSSMSAGQLLPLCIMVGYRGNGPYNEAMLPYIALQPHINDRLVPMIVLTNEPEKRKDRPHWNENETLANKVGCPFTVLHGSLDYLMENFSPQGAPEFFIINQSGKIVWAGDLGTDVEYWDLLAEV